ncbi:MAG: DNA polymerase IV [Thermoleophilia bacterium]
MFVSQRAILHLDMDAFFASVEQARRPELSGLPVVVGGERGGRGVVSACSYEARVYGVHSAMPIFQAERLCPRGVFLPVDMKAYLAVHHAVLELLGRYTDLVEVASIDEAYLDVTGSRRLFGPPRAIALRIQEQVYDAHGVTCSIGIGPTKLLAKLAAGLNKPAGVGELTAADVHGRLRELPVGEVCGIGPVTRERLAALGLTTVGMLQDVPFPLLAAAFGRGAHGLRQLALGRSFSPVRSARPLPKSVGREITFTDDTNDLGLLRATLLSLADHAVAELRRNGMAARTVALKVRFNTFHTVGRRRTLARPVSATRPLYETAVALLDELDIGARWVRLVGVSVGNLSHGAFQLTLDDGWREVALGQAVDRVRARYGSAALTLAGAAPARRHFAHPSPALAFTPPAPSPEARSGA